MVTCQSQTSMGHRISSEARARERSRRCGIRGHGTGRLNAWDGCNRVLSCPLPDGREPVFEALSDRLQGVFRRLTGQAKLTPDNIREGLREVRRALLEADVQVAVARDFVARVEARAVGEDVLKSLTAGQQVVGIVRDELESLPGK